MSDKYTGDMDPEIAALLGSGDNSPAFDDLFDSPKKTVESAVGQVQPQETQPSFRQISVFANKPRPVFESPNYYKQVLSDLGETAARVHKILTDLINATDPEARGQARMRFIPSWWDFLEAMVRSLSEGLPEPKLLALRFGVLLPSLLTPEQRNNLSSIIMENDTGEMVHYWDEWLFKVGSGEVAPLATDEEVRPVKKGSTDNTALVQRFEKLQGQVQAQTNLIAHRLKEMNDLEDLLVKASTQARQHDKHPVFVHLSDNLNGTQKAALSSINDSVKRLVALDRETELFYRDLEKMSNELRTVEAKLNESGGVASVDTKAVVHEKMSNELRTVEAKLNESGGVASVDTKAVVHELSSLRQMCKLAVGRQGNHFPVAMKQYLPARIEDLGTRENVLTVMAGVERLDPGLFLRSFKGMTNRIVPHVILLPSFGESGLCWEPFEKYNRSTSRGRIAIPMYSKNLKNAVLTALADLRWQVVKEKAGYRWMEEGLTGWYYQWFTDRGFRGDVKESFIQDYILWITKESEGTQKLDKEVRGIFWRNMPYPQDLREVLRNRGFVYNELYKKDINRAMSDGY